MNVIHYRREPLEPPPSDELKRGRPRIYDDEQRVLQHREAVKRHQAKVKARRAGCFFVESGMADRSRLSTDLSTKSTPVVNSLSLAIVGELLK